MATPLKIAVPQPVGSQETQHQEVAPSSSFHWSMRLMSLISLFALGLYSYVLRLCRRQSRLTAAFPRDARIERRRMHFAALAFGLDLIISAYFGAVTPLLLEKGGLAFDRKQMPRPLFWFFAITGFVPTASMALTVIGGQRWQNKIKSNTGWRTFHGITALLAYFSWWLACSPVFFLAVVGEERAIEILRKSGMLDYMSNSALPQKKR